jgi:hypothetical protein
VQLIALGAESGSEGAHGRRQCLSATYYAVAKRPNALGALRRSDSHVGALASIHRCASCWLTKPGIWSRLPSGHATRTYHPEADLRGRASKAGLELGSFIARDSRNTIGQNATPFILFQCQGAQAGQMLSWSRLDGTRNRRFRFRGVRSLGGWNICFLWRDRPKRDSLSLIRLPAWLRKSHTPKQRRAIGTRPKACALFRRGSVTGA